VVDFPRRKQSQLTALPPQVYAESMDYRKIITMEPDKRGGKPCIRGMRITVGDILDYLAGGMTMEEVVDDFPDITREDILACLAYAADRERTLHSVSPQ